MEFINHVQDMTKEFIATYGTRISKIEDIVTSTYDIIEDCREKRTSVREQLQSVLAQKKSLRKKDFDSMLNDLHLAQTECERQIKATLRIYTSEHKNLAAEFLESMVTGKVDQSKETMAKIEMNGKEIQNTLNSFRSEQEEIARDLNALLEKSESIRIKDFKKMINKIRERQQERNEKIKCMLQKISEEHTQMRAIWNEISEEKSKLRFENLNN